MIRRGGAGSYSNHFGGLQPLLGYLVGRIDPMGRHALLPGNPNEGLSVRRVVRADDENQITRVRQLLDHFLSVGGCIAEV